MRRANAGAECGAEVWANERSETKAAGWHWCDGGSVAARCAVRLRTGTAWARTGAGRTLASLTEEQRTDLQKKLADLDAKSPPPVRATVKDFVDHIDYAVKKIGVDHVGISSDFDGGGGVDGWNSGAATCCA